MRKLTVAVMALGCLALLIGTIAVTLPQTGQARGVGFRPSFQGCADAGSAALCPQSKPDDVKKVMICHFNLGKEFGKAKCQEESGGGAEGGYNAHISTEVVQGHDRDYCIVNADEIAECEGKK